MHTSEDSERTSATDEGTKKWRLSEFVKALPLSIVAVIGVYFTAAEYFSRQPNVAVDFVSGELRAELIDADEIVRGLEKIEDDHDEMTGLYVFDLIDATKRLEERATSDALVAFRDLLQERIDGFDVDSLVDSLRIVEDGIHRETIPLDGVTTELERIEEKYAALTGAFVIDLIEENESIDAIGNEGFNEALRVAILHFREVSQDDDARYDDLRQDLSELLNSVERHIHDDDKRLYVIANIENRSRAPTIIRSNAIVRIWNDAQSYKDIDLNAMDNRDMIISEISVVEAEFNSKKLRDLDSEVRWFLKQEISSRSNCLIFLVDMHGSVWNTDSRCTRNRGA